MRTTLNIDDDVLREARSRARAGKRTVGEEISDLARAGLTAPANHTPRRIIHKNGWAVLEGTGEVVTNELINQLKDELGI